MTHFVTFSVSKHQETKESDTKDAVETSKLQCCSIFRKLIENRFSAMEYVLSHYTLTNEVRVIEGEIIKKMT